MADLPITSDEGATPIVINDPTTTANVANVKAASTASVAADNSLVVALSPNSPVPTGTNKIGVTGVTQGSTTSGQNGDLVQGAVTTAAPTYVTAQTSPLSLTTVGNLRVDGSSVTQPISGTVTANQGTANATPWNENIAQYGGTSTSLGQKVMASSIPVAIASDQPGSPTNLDKNGSGTITALNGTVSATTNGCSSCNFNITGTWSATLTIQGTVDGTNWNTIDGDVDITDTIESTITVNSLVNVVCGGYQSVRLIATAFTSGTVNIAWDASSGNNIIEVFNTNAASLMATVNIRDGSGNALTSTALDSKQGLDVNLIASPSQSGAASGQIYTTSFEVNLPTNGTATPAVFIKNPNGSGKTLVLKKLISMPVAAVNGAAFIQVWANPTTSANGTSQTATSTSIGGGASASAMTVFSGPTVSADGTLLFSVTTSSGNVSSNGEMPVDFDGLIRLSTNNTLLVTGTPSTNNLNCTFTVIWQEV